MYRILILLFIAKFGFSQNRISGEVSDGQTNETLTPTHSYIQSYEDCETCLSNTTKIAIIFPGLLFDKQFWWLYIFAIASSVALIWTSTRKTLPTIILFNVAWNVLASLSILKHFWWF